MDFQDNRTAKRISLVMRRSIRKFNIPPGQPPGHLNFWRLACSNSFPSGQKSRSNAPPISTELSLLKDKFRLQSNTLHAFQREICYNDTFKLLLKTLLKELFTNKGEIPSHGRITSEQEINPVQIPHPSNSTFKFPPPRARCTVKCLGYARGGDVEVSTWLAHKRALQRRKKETNDFDNVIFAEGFAKIIGKKARTRFRLHTKLSSLLKFFQSTI